MWQALGKLGAQGGRMAGNVAGKASGRLAQTMSRNPVPGMKLTDLRAEDWMDRLWMDALFGGVQGFMTPGSIDEKIAVGIGATVGGGLGGATLSSALPAKLRNANGFARQAAEVAGGFGGDFVGTMGAEAGIRAKDVLMGGSGQTGWEKLAEEDRRLMEQQILAAHGLGPYQPTDMFMAQNGLG